VKDIIIIGAGGHAKACVDVINSENKYNIVGLVDSSMAGDGVLGIPIIGTDDDLDKIFFNVKNAIIGIGQIKSSETRVRLYKKLLDIGFSLPVVKSSRSYVSDSSSIGEGSIIMHDVIVNSAAKIGKNCILNSKSLIEHDVSIGDNTHISTGAIINGHVKIGTDCFIGSGAVVKQSVKISDYSIIGAGVVLKKNTKNNQLII
jgi:sugar O-acyltransferase (sialic acid O-acetyltransferase NeuD family)